MTTFLKVIHVSLCNSDGNLIPYQSSKEQGCSQRFCLSKQWQGKSSLFREDFFFPFPTFPIDFENSQCDNLQIWIWTLTEPHEAPNRLLRIAVRYQWQVPFPKHPLESTGPFVKKNPPHASRSLPNEQVPNKWSWSILGCVPWIGPCDVRVAVVSWSFGGTCCFLFGGCGGGKVPNFVDIQTNR